MATSDSLIQVRNLKKHYHRGAIKALDGVTADINKGDVMVVIGPSGSGKSTFLRSLNLLEEPTDGEIQTAHKGRYWFEVTMHGKAAHASCPEQGMDAIAGMAYLLASARNRMKKLKEDPFLGKSTIVFGEIQGGVHPYQVPAECKVSVDMRVVPPYHIGDVKALLEAAAEDAAKEIPGLQAEIKVTGNRPPIAHHEDAKLLACLKAAVEAATGKASVVSAFPGYTDTAVIAGMTGNCNCLSYGPGTLAMAHKADEYVDEADIRRCQKVYEVLVERWLWA